MIADAPVNALRTAPGRLAIAVAISLGGWCSSLGAQTSQPDRRPPERPERPESTAPASRPLSPTAALSRAIALLTQEAKQAQEDGELLRSSPNFARSFEHEVSPVAVAGRLLKPLNRDPFVDAYVRWQLTGFSDGLDEAVESLLREMDAREFEKLLADLPALYPNPRTDRSLISMLMRAQNAESLSESDQERLNEILNELAARTSSAAALNRPATEFRAWIERRVGESGPRHHQARLERCAATVAAGWNVERVKREIAEAFEAARRDVEFTTAERERVAEQARRLVGRRTLIVASARLNAGLLDIAYDESAVYDFEVNDWTRALAGR